jgi:hypothetical protein
MDEWSYLLQLSFLVIMMFGIRRVTVTSFGI